MDTEPRPTLADRLVDYPFLRLLLCEKWFLFGVGAVVLVLLTAIVMLPKIWRTSPPDFTPVIRVSLLDRMQAWSLKRAARASAAEGDYERANYSFLAAVANNRADTEALRGLLRNYLAHDRAIREARYAPGQAIWLLRLTGTNLADLELAAETLERRRFYDLVLQFVESRQKELTPKLQALQLRCLFNNNRPAAFNALWPAASPAVQQDPEMALYRAGYLAVWGEHGASPEARASLENALNGTNFPQRLLAARMLLFVAVRANDPDAYLKHLRILEDGRADTLSQHVAYWRLLHENSRKDEAQRLVEVHAFPPTSPAELVDLARFFGLAGQPERARQLFERGEQEFGFSPGFWLAYADQLMETRQWAQASEWARRVRQHETVGDILLAFSYFVEGRAEAQLGREVSASDAFEKMKALEFPSPELAMRAASEVLNLGRAPVAAATLVRVEEALVHDPRYWALRFRVADAMRDVEAMVQAARRAYEMQPSNPLLVNNYAAALLIQRNNPDAAVRLTLQLFTATPGSLPAQINHAAALLLNGRLAEAEKILAGVATNGLSPGQMSFYAFDRFELAIRQNRLSEARNWLERVDEAALYPPQQAWLEEARKRMAAPEPRG